MFKAKYGKEYVEQACADATCDRCGQLQQPLTAACGFWNFRWNVNEQLRRCLTVEPPEPAVKCSCIPVVLKPHHNTQPRWNVNEQLRRCLTMEPPEPAIKLQTLSDIAQEVSRQLLFKGSCSARSTPNPPRRAGCCPHHK